MQEEPLRWSGGSGGCAGAGGEDGGDVLKVDVAATHIEHGAYQVSDHVVEKSIAANSIDEEFPVIRPALFPVG